MAESVIRLVSALGDAVWCAGMRSCSSISVAAAKVVRQKQCAAFSQLFDPEGGVPSPRLGDDGRTKEYGNKKRPV